MLFQELCLTRFCQWCFRRIWETMTEVESKSFGSPILVVWFYLMSFSFYLNVPLLRLWTGWYLLHISNLISMRTGTSDTGRIGGQPDARKLDRHVGFRGKGSLSDDTWLLVMIEYPKYKIHYLNAPKFLLKHETSWHSFEQTQVIFL